MDGHSFDLRWDHGFRNPPFHPPRLFPGAWQAAPQSRRHPGAFSFRRPPGMWRSDNHYQQLQQQRQQQQQQTHTRPPPPPTPPQPPTTTIIEQGNRSNGTWSDSSSGGGLDATQPTSSQKIADEPEGQSDGGTDTASGDERDNDDDDIAAGGDNGAARVPEDGGSPRTADGLSAMELASALNGALRGRRQTVVGSRAVAVQRRPLETHEEGAIGEEDEEEEGEGEGEEEEYEGEEEDPDGQGWTMSSVWAEHFRNSPSVQRYLERMQAKQGASKWKDTRGGQGKNGKGASGRNSNKKGSRTGASKSGGTTQNGAKTKDAGKSSNGTVAAAADSESLNEAKPMVDAKQNMELELAKIKARALLYAEKQQDRSLEEAVAHS